MKEVHFMDLDDAVQRYVLFLLQSVVVDSSRPRYISVELWLENGEKARVKGTQADFAMHSSDIVLTGSLTERTPAIHDDSYSETHERGEYRRGPTGQGWGPVVPL